MDVLPVEVMDALFVAGAETTLNVALFVPVGMAVAALLPLRWAWLAAGFGAVLSIVIETAQAAIPGRVPDVDDVLANTAGAILGTAVVILVRLVARTAAALSRSRG
ncbi:MAG: VanZ family protein [Actinobacteria bacterium]|nr:VanZ family protein [Actinomycetota bacterium]